MAGERYFHIGHSPCPALVFLSLRHAFVVPSLCVRFLKRRTRGGRPEGGGYIMPWSGVAGEALRGRLYTLYIR
ncbi:MAG: hypothetical protein IJK84_01320 [Bacteroidales bacterium]|nr:hypothetical protein [Bacteroidales bacterium]